jgi:hypothetical protein
MPTVVNLSFSQQSADLSELSVQLLLVEPDTLPQQSNPGITQ